MTKKIEGFGGLLAEFAKNQVAAVMVAEASLAIAAKMVQEDAQDRIGEYQDAAGGFPAWAPLADSTEAEKARLGYPADAPLLRDGTLRDSIEYEVEGNEAIVGSKLPVAAYQEFGTSRGLPPRPFLGPAAVSCGPAIAKMVGTVAALGLSSGEFIPDERYYLGFKDQEK